MESLPALIRILLSDGDYLKTYLIKIQSLRNLKNQTSNAQIRLIAQDGEIIKEILNIQIADQKRHYVLNGFTDTSGLEVLARRKELVNAGINPNTGEPLTDLNLNDLVPAPIAGEESPQIETAVEADAQNSDANGEVNNNLFNF